MGDRYVDNKNGTVTDTETNLMWQQGSSERMMWHEGFEYVDKLNEQEFAGYSDWRYPSKEELATLLQEEENLKTRLYLDPIFKPTKWCWTSTQRKNHMAVYVDFYYGGVYRMQEKYANYFVRAVRNAK